MTTNLSFTLKDISSWTMDESNVKIPELQRGLVWKPAQVELLWDSILRGFPIGSFMLSDIPDDKGRYYLMDGQQRFNAISIGFGSVENSRAILWLDINPENTQNSSRTFWVKSTTIAHPWGFTNNDECGTLSVADRRSALDEFGLHGQNIYNEVVDLHSTWPVKASRPIPLQFFLNAPVKDKDAFTKYIISKCQEKSNFRCLEKNPVTEADSERISSFYDAFYRLVDYRICCNHLTRDVVENESSVTNNDGGVTTLETLFTRLNTGGTRITQEDLSYSAIKAYWPEIKDKNDRIAERYMPPAKLVMLAFRLELTDPSQDKTFKGAMSVKQIRSLVKDKMSKQRIDDLYGSDKLERIMKVIDEWLNVFNAEKNPSPDSTPAVLRTSIARNSTDIYLLLMYFASESLEGKMDLSVKEIMALAFYLHWFSNDAAARVVTEVYSQCRKGITIEAIRRAISLSFVNKWLVAPYTPDEMRHFFTIKPDPKWRVWSEDYYPWQDFIERVYRFGPWQTKEMLLYAQRMFINTHFRMYDPARQDMWDSHNCPWDYDHIIPQEWIANKRGAFRDYCKDWLWSIGNIAAIPFEENRSKSNREDYGFYLKNEKTLLFDESSINFKNDIVWNQEESYSFASVTFERCCKIYKCCYDIFAPLFENIELSDDLQERKDILLKVADGIEGSKCYFAAGIKDYPLERDLDWTREWICVGVPYGKYLACVCWGYGQTTLEFGLRKLPGTLIDKDRNDMPKLDDSYNVYEDSQWWYAWKELTIKEQTIGNTTKVIITELSTLVGFLQE